MQLCKKTTRISPCFKSLPNLNHSRPFRLRGYSENIQRCRFQIEGEDSSLVAQHEVQGANLLRVDAGTCVPLPLHQAPNSEQSTLKPFLLYLPDLDGMGLTSKISWPALSQQFEMQVLQLGPNFLGSFSELLDFIADHMECNLLNQAPLNVASPERPIYLLGDGMGALIALAVAEKCPHLVDRLILINPATSIRYSPVAALSPVMTQILPHSLSSIMTFALSSALIGSPGNLISLIRSTATGGLTSTLEQVKQISQSLPPYILKHRLAFMEEGITHVESKISQVTQRTMVLVGGSDLLLPSQLEGVRLAQLMQRAFVKVLPGLGHALLAEQSLNMIQLMEQEGFLLEKLHFTSKPYDRKFRLKQGQGFGQAGPLEVPGKEEVQRVASQMTGALRTACSPVFLSTLPDGQVVHGLEGLPIPMEGKPLLLVGNHQLMAQDMHVLVEEILLNKGVLVRGLAHPNLFSSEMDRSKEASNKEEQHSSRSEGVGIEFPSFIGNIYHTFGAVEVSAANLYRLLRAGEAVLLYPGGAREAFKHKLEKYELFWPKKSEFVRMASRFSATVVPISAIGLEDSLHLLVDNLEMRRGPGPLGKLARDLAERAQVARPGVTADPGMDDCWLPPVVAPAVPSRLYFLFGRPLHLTPDLYDDKVQCQQLYTDIKGQVEDGISYLLRRREGDPYGKLLERLLYENPPLGQRRQAPTFRL